MFETLIWIVSIIVAFVILVLIFVQSPGTSFAVVRLIILYVPLNNLAMGVKEDAMTEKFTSILSNLLRDMKISQSDYDRFMAMIQDSQDWLDRNYYDIQVFFGLREPTSKFKNCSI